MIAFLIIGILLIVLGLLWGKRINERNNDGDMGAGLLAVLCIIAGVVILLALTGVYLAEHVHWG